MDNHLSHISIPLIAFCWANGIELFGLHTHSSTLDIAFFHPFKEAWKKTVPKWKNENNVRRLKKEDFPIVLEKNLNGITEEKTIIINGFRGSGLHPFQLKAVDCDVLKKAKK